MVDDRIKNGVLKHYEQGLDMTVISQKMNTKKDLVTEILVTDLYQKGNSYNDIVEELELKKHVVEGILNGVQKNAETPIATPTTVIAPPKQTPLAETLNPAVVSARERELALELAILQEKNRSIDLQNKQIESMEITQRKKIELDNQIAQRNLDLQNKRFDAEQKQAKKDALIQAQKENAAKHKAETAALQKRINAFIENYYDDIDEDGNIVIDEDDSKDLSKAAKKLYSEMSLLFSGVNIDDTLHGKLLAILIKDLTPKRLNGDLDLDYPDHELKLFADCLTKGVILGDSENNFESDDED